ncbi:NAD(P)H-dependent flavin oxidoreductase [Desulfosporosinus nitroreducens]|uniref:Probable nitronate monooxygenase n=1 Tax=Desulfosporosinus nitroreducens TaxID=2018668 RepID=A0ABT8QJY4_9FIRM|nr:nitronate monooxygenase [Desulfosporosinus nitroreducens]MCO1601129.1 nitronate monooxygenase [Desulfosporosinus nitroreducens]MDO0821634.1 nitronate monooxygenase [Desulfosporosinus nitroreducens]
MKIPDLRIGNLVARIPVIQGGMAVRISMAPLAAAVAEEGGIGIIAGSGLSVEELKAEIREARKRTKGIIGVNIMFAVREFAQLVHAAFEEKIDLLVSGAGFSRDMFTWGKEKDIPVVPIVSSAKLAKLSQKLGAAAVVVEGAEAGGHLGTDRSIYDILPEVVAAVSIPVIGAGGVIDGQGVAKMLKLGVDGVQMGTRFALSEESSAALAWKAEMLKAKEEDVIFIHSPVGMLARGIKSPFTQLLDEKVDVTPTECMGCLKQCEGNFCIMSRLVKAQTGNVREGLIFSGAKVHKINEVLSVHEIFEDIKKEILSVKEE